MILFAKTVSAFFLPLALATTASPLGEGPQRLVGSWTCSGYFVKSGKPLTGELSIHPDPATGTLVVHHDDRLGGGYHSFEIWNTSPAQDLYRSAVSDPNGMRVYQSQGWRDGRFDWDRIENGVVIERFSYRLSEGDQLRIDWSIDRNNSGLAVGDTLTCHREGASPAD